MPNIKSAKKRVKVIETKTLQNKMHRTALKTEMKKYDAALASGDMEAAQAVGAVIPMVTAGTGGDYQTAAVFAGKGFIAGVGLVITLFVLLSFIFTVHNDLPYCFFMVISLYRIRGICQL